MKNSCLQSPLRIGVYPHVRRTWGFTRAVRPVQPFVEVLKIKVLSLFGYKSGKWQPEEV